MGRGKHEIRKTKKRKGKKIALIILIIIVILLGVIVGGGYGYLRSKLGQMNYVDISEEDIEINEGINNQLAGYRNIVLLGIDTRYDTYEGSRTDCIIIATINEKTKEIKLTSVYRDTYLEITGKSLDKVNHAYSTGGAALTLSTLNTNLDLNIKEFVTVNFDAIVKIVDAIGGVEIDINSEELKYINGYIDENNRVTGSNSSHITKTGKQNLDGVQALAYSRIRYTSGGDYKRTERMRTVLVAALNKAKTMSVTKLNSLADTLLPSMETNISANEIIGLLPQAAQYKVTDSIGWPYNTKGATINGVWYGPPLTLERNVKQLHKDLFGQDNYEPSSTVKRISEAIINKTGYK